MNRPSLPSPQGGSRPVGNPGAPQGASRPAFSFGGGSSGGSGASSTPNPNAMPSGWQGPPSPYAATGVPGGSIGARSAHPLHISNLMNHPAVSAILNQPAVRAMATPAGTVATLGMGNPVGMMARGGEAATGFNRALGMRQNMDAMNLMNNPGAANTALNSLYEMIKKNPQLAASLGIR